MANSAIRRESAPRRHLDATLAPVHGAYDPELWHDFAVAVAGAGAALAGLLVVAVSVNIRDVIAGPTLTRRAALALVLVTVPLVLALVLLIPERCRAGRPPRLIEILR